MGRQVTVALDTSGTLEGTVDSLVGAPHFDPGTYKIRTTAGNWFYARPDQVQLQEETE
jgi:hypothetical protein